jgi:hypothetical protein
LGALGCLAIGISGGEAVAETPSQADIAGQLMPEANAGPGHCREPGTPVGNLRPIDRTPPRHERCLKRRIA